MNDLKIISNPRNLKQKSLYDEINNFRNFWSSNYNTVNTSYAFLEQFLENFLENEKYTVLLDPVEKLVTSYERITFEWGS